MISDLKLILFKLNTFLDSQCRIKDNNISNLKDIKLLIQKIKVVVTKITQKYDLKEYGEAVKEDLDTWLSKKCIVKPNFEKSRDVLKSPENGKIFFL